MCKKTASIFINKEPKWGYRFYPFNSEGCVRKEGNLAVIKNTGGYPHEYFCGYCVFRINEIPRKWRSSFSMDELHYLNVHGGVTYVRCETNLLGLSKILYSLYKWIYRAKTPIYALCKRIKRKDTYWFVNPVWRATTGLVEGISGALGDYIVFGFDCAHVFDTPDAPTQNLDYVWKLTVQMEQQIRELAKRHREYLKADKERRLRILDEVRATGEEHTEMGMGAMLGLLSGARDLEK